MRGAEQLRARAGLYRALAVKRESGVAGDRGVRIERIDKKRCDGRYRRQRYGPVHADLSRPSYTTLGRQFMARGSGIDNPEAKPVA